MVNWRKLTSGMPVLHEHVVDGYRFKFLEGTAYGSSIVIRQSPMGNAFMRGVPGVCFLCEEEVPIET